MKSCVSISISRFCIGLGAVGTATAFPNCNFVFMCALKKKKIETDMFDLHSLQSLQKDCEKSKSS